MNRVARAAAGAAFSAVLLFFLVRQLARNAPQVGPLILAMRPGWAILSLVLLAAAYLGYGLIWRAILHELGGRIDGLAGWRVWALSQLGKYVPGKIWGALGRVVLLGRSGVDAAPATLSVAYELLLFVLSGLLFAGAVSPAWSPLGLAGVGALGLLVAFLPLASRGLSRLAGYPAPPFRASAVLAVVAAYELTWLLTGAAFAAFLFAIHPVPAPRLAGAAGAFVLSWVAGSIVFVAPAGLGVREGVLLAALSPVVPHEVALLAVAGSRVWTTAVELAAVGLALLAQDRTSTTAATEK
ncbi:MAG TPA: lysylphosphatidylglycerol synthase domain-containing protein [Candidatus Polarisedimenticolaceae bacterium]|nr:lysylphosphatidylglycerol synthase domain-containing protein [Candidatus Polarisedimenticolaceae bacterium]